MSASSCSTDVPAIFSGVHPNATSRAVAACVIGSFVCEDSMALTSVTNRRPFASGAASSEIFSQPMVSTGAPPAARICLIRRRTSGQSLGGANGGAPGDARVADVDAPHAPRSGVACSTFNSTWSRFLRFAEGLESLARRDAAERAAGDRSGIFAESGDTARARARAGTEGEGDVGQNEMVLLVPRSDDVGRRGASGGRDVPPWRPLSRGRTGTRCARCATVPATPARSSARPGVPGGVPM